MTSKPRALAAASSLSLSSSLPQTTSISLVASLSSSAATASLIYASPQNKATFITSQDQATWVGCVIRIFFNHLSGLQHISNFFYADFSLEHSLDSMKTIGDFFVTHSRAFINLAVVPYNKPFSIQKALDCGFLPPILAVAV
jgi:hypothetical protein